LKQVYEIRELDRQRRANAVDFLDRRLVAADDQNWPARRRRRHNDVGAGLYYGLCNDMWNDMFYANRSRSDNPGVGGRDPRFWGGVSIWNIITPYNV